LRRGMEVDVHLIMLGSRGTVRPLRPGEVADATMAGVDEEQGESVKEVAGNKAASVAAEATAAASEEAAERTRERTLTMDLCLRIGELLLASGAGAADGTATMQSVAQHLGLRHSEIDVTF